ncbi:hypothetical protein Taro_011165 [Colocasia esculenta]|uniref:Uncharacterized protein n=1 Tax=Colocasia esculenta TaxID=4460 RepID=A0A843U544_COLES|nr:hypothetical protein [Colocasia esculenta]
MDREPEEKGGKTDMKWSNNFKEPGRGGSNYNQTETMDGERTAGGGLGVVGCGLLQMLGDSTERTHREKPGGRGHLGCGGEGAADGHGEGEEKGEGVMERVDESDKAAAEGGRLAV